MRRLYQKNAPQLYVLALRAQTALHVNAENRTRHDQTDQSGSKQRVYKEHLFFPTPHTFLRNDRRTVGAVHLHQHHCKHLSSQRVNLGLVYRRDLRNTLAFEHDIAGGTSQELTGRKAPVITTSGCTFPLQVG